MKARSCALLVGLVVLAAAGCGDGGPTLPTQAKDLLILVKRVTVPSDAPGRAEIEVLVQSGSTYTGNAPDGTIVEFTASHGHFEGGSDSLKAPIHAGRTTVTLVLAGASQYLITAEAGAAVAEIKLIVFEDGSVQLGTY